MLDCSLIIYVINGFEFKLPVKFIEKGVKYAFYEYLYMETGPAEWTGEKAYGERDISKEYTNNYPERVDAFIKQYQAEGYFKQFPFGTDVTQEEAVLGGALKGLVAYKGSRPLSTVRKLVSEMLRPVPEKAAPYLKRMDLEKPKGLGQKFQQKMVLTALRHAGRI